MTQKQRDLGRAITVTILAVIMLLGALSSCTVYKQPQLKITSVLAVTAEGDTLQLPIDVIRPIYNYNTYPTNRFPIGYGHNTFYYSPWRNHSFNPNINDYRPLPNNNNNPNISQSNNSPAPRVDRITNPPVNPPNPGANNPRKNN